MGYGPKNCVECGSPLSGVPIRVTVDLNGKVFAVPGLYRCNACEGLIAQGAIKTNITPEEAFMHLAGDYIPTMSLGLLTKGDILSDFMKLVAEAALGDAIDVASELADYLSEQPQEAPQGQEGGFSTADKEKMLDSIELGEDGGVTFKCPYCEQRHDATRLFEVAGIFASES
jgi:hypothetical protein